MDDARVPVSDELIENRTFDEISVGESARPLKIVSRGGVAGIGTTPRFTSHDPAGTILTDRSWPDRNQSFHSLLEYVLEWVEEHLGEDALSTVGHRVVHGGPLHNKPERVTPELLLTLDGLRSLAPLHQSHNIAPMRALAAMRTQLPQVACFDTAFHHGMPRVATLFALPREYEVSGVRRYGFHGLSYEYVSRRLREIAPGLADGRVIAAHLGNGASLCAMRNGRSIDTSMGFTGLDGLVMGTRSGSLDPGVILYLEQERGMNSKEIEDLLYRRSGLLGVSGGIASDMRLLLASSDARAKEAVELFVFRVAREIGALVSSLDGLDGLVFTAGIGENSALIRALICARLDWLGVTIDQETNAQNGAVISSVASSIVVRVIPTDEEAMIATHTQVAIQGASALEEASA